ncbi:hypothetical protein ACFXGT_35230 [Streptomyces sp. NPDC059352]|uniref:hypothetical protein n=1 Tax=Streptomyces sp. NPDC059352 TaxID=3346810 RepID=UPI0036A2F1AA
MATIHGARRPVAGAAGRRSLVPLADRSLVPLFARAVRAVEGVVDVRMGLGAHEDAA